MHYLSGGRIEWWRPIIRELEPYARPIGEVLAILALPLALVGGVFVRAVKPPKLEIAEFNDDNADVKVAKSLTALLRDRIKYFSANLLPRLGFIDGPSRLVALPAAISTAIPSAASWINWLPSLIDAINPRRVLTVSGTLHPAGENGAGMTITLRERNQVLFTSTLWQRDFDPHADVPLEADTARNDPSGYHELAEPAAIWLLFRLSGGQR